LQAILDVYDLRFRELKPFYWLFLASIAVVLVTLLVTTWSRDWAQTALSLNPVCQLMILLLSVHAYTVQPGRLSSAPYLVHACDINPHLLAEALKLGLHFRPCNPSFHVRTREEPLSIQLTFRFRVHGFRFVLIVADENGIARFVSFGPMTAQTKFFRHLLDRSFGFQEMNDLEIGRCKLNAIRGRACTVSLLIFMPLFRDDELFPMFGSLRFEGGTERDELVSGHSGIAALRPDRVYRGVRFRGLGSKLTSFEVSSAAEEREEPIASVLERYRREIMKTRRLRQYEL
jgi:hypothetical protein